MDIPTKTNKVQRDKLQPKRNDLLSYPTSNGPNIYPTQPIQIDSFKSEKTLWTLYLKSFNINETFYSTMRIFYPF